MSGNSAPWVRSLVGGGLTWLAVATAWASSPPSIPFHDITQASGVTFVQQNGAHGDKLLPETMGGGVAFFDYDGDGDQDLLLLHSSATADPPAALYANDGHGHFHDVTVASGLATALGKGFLGMGVAAADFDGDGWTDLYLTAVGRNRLLRNRDGHFVDVTAAAGVAGPVNAWSTAAVFFDADGDGDLDLFVANYVEWSRAIDAKLNYHLPGIGRAYARPQDYAGSDALLFENRGDGTFADVSQQAGVQVHDADGKPLGKGMAAVAADFDGDGWTDLFVANDTVRNFLFHNQGHGHFAEEGELWGVAYDADGRTTGAMGVDIGDPDGDGRQVLVVGNFANEASSVYRAEADPTFFTDVSLAAGIAAPTYSPLSFSTLLFDADLDGYLDFLQVNGHLEPDITRSEPTQHYHQAPQLFWNDGGHRAPVAANAVGETRPTLHFVPLPPGTLGDLATPIAGRGAAWADLDGDGDLDLVLTQIAAPTRLLRNDQASGHHWLRLHLMGGAPGPRALGAEITLTAGGRHQRRLVRTSRGYLSQVEKSVTFGLGDLTSIDEVAIRWPDATVQRLDGVSLAVDHDYVIAPP